MMRKLLIVAVLLTTASVGFLPGQSSPLSSPKQGVAEASGGKNGSGHGQPDNGQQSATHETPSAPQPATPGCDEACEQGRDNLAIQWKLELFTGVLAVVGVLQVSTMIWQGILLAGTWKTIEKQSRLTEFAQKPWIKIEHWEVEVEDAKEATCYFSVVNPTEFPLTLREVITEVQPMVMHGGMPESPASRKTYQISENKMMAPHEKYVCQVPITIRQEDRANFENGHYMAYFYITVHILNADGKEVPQRIMQLGMLGPKKFTYMTMKGAIPNTIPNEKRSYEEGA